MSFKKVEDDIRPILKESMAARCDDMALYANYAYGKIEGLNYGMGWLQKIFSDRRFRIIHGIAPYGTVSRVRRKLQETNEDLRPTAEYKEERRRLELRYKKYAREGATK